MEFLYPGDILLYSMPVYGGTDHFIKHILTKYGIEVIGFTASDSKQDLIDRLEATGKADRLRLIFAETPANPTNKLIDLTMCKELKDKYSTDEVDVLLAVDNTYMGPLWQSPLKLGADLVLYSATKYIGGHSDVIAGACLGSAELMGRVKVLRTFLGNMASPHTGWLLMRSLETLKIRMEKQAENAAIVADKLKDHSKLVRVNYLGLLNESDGEQYEIFKRNKYSCGGAMLSLELKGGEKEAFKMLNSLKLVKLAVSLGSTESLAQHPASMTHAGIDPEEKVMLGIKDSVVRISVGVENAKDLIWDIEQALEQV
jgi:methionine-gamma-lyase